MASRSDITYFGAGPASLPTDVLEEAAKALLNYNATGLGSKSSQRPSTPILAYSQEAPWNGLSSAVLNE